MEVWVWSERSEYLTYLPTMFPKLVPQNSKRGRIEYQASVDHGISNSRKLSHAPCGHSVQMVEKTHFHWPIDTVWRNVFDGTRLYALTGIYGGVQLLVGSEKRERSPQRVRIQEILLVNNATSLVGSRIPRNLIRSIAPIIPSVYVNPTFE
jgi:hypothetical protein